MMEARSLRGLKAMRRKSRRELLMPGERLKRRIIMTTQKASTSEILELRKRMKARFERTKELKAQREKDAKDDSEKAVSSEA